MASDSPADDSSVVSKAGIQVVIGRCVMMDVPTVLELLLLQLLVHDDTRHLLLHLDHCLRVKEAICEVEDVLALHEKGHQTALIWLGKEMRLDCINGKWLIALRSSIDTCSNSTDLIKRFETALVIRLMAQHLLGLCGF